MNDTNQENEKKRDFSKPVRHQLQASFGIFAPTEMAEEGVTIDFGNNPNTLTVNFAKKDTSFNVQISEPKTLQKIFNVFNMGGGVLNMRMFTLLLVRQKLLLKQVGKTFTLVS